MSRAVLIQDADSVVQTFVGGWRVAGDSVLVDWYDFAHTDSYAFVMDGAALRGRGRGTSDHRDCEQGSSRCTFITWERPIAAKRVPCPTSG